MGRNVVLEGLMGLLAVELLAGDTVGPQVAGYRRDGTGVFPDCAPPTSGLKVQWATELPSWGHSSPIEVGARVYLTVEPMEGVRDFPALLCLDGATGKILWDRPLDHLAAVPDADREPARAAWHEVMADYARRQAFCREYERIKDTNAMAAAGYAYDARWKKVVARDEKPIVAKLKIAQKAGFSLETWRHGCSGGSTVCVGDSYATPVSDGKHLWSVTAWGGFFCHDLDGNLVWSAFAPGKQGEFCRNGRSPILWKHLLLSDITAVARAFDAATGKLVWSHPLADHAGLSVVSPMVLTTGGRDILWAADCRAFLLPDGTPLTVEGWKDGGMQTLVKYDERDVIFFCGSGEHCGWTDKGGGKAEYTPPAAVRFALEGQTLKAMVLWNGRTAGAGNMDFAAGNKPWMTYYDGGFYHINGAILDPLTGAVKVGTVARRHNANVAVPKHDHLLLAANGHVYGLTRGGDLSVFTAAGKKVSEFKITPAVTDKNLGWTEGTFKGGDGPSFTLGKTRIYCRGNLHLYGIGN